MKAIVYDQYGAADVLHATELPKPTPKANEVLIKVHATTVTTGDWRARSLEMPAGFGVLGRLVFGLFAPRQKILGTELAGRIEAIGADVTKFEVGDEVFAFTGAKMGCYVEYKCLPQDALIVRKPSNLSFQQAVGLSFGGNTALDVLRKGGIKKGDKVLVNGASGGVGSACVQLAKHFGAEVTGVCSTANIELVRSLGADKVVDYSKEDFTKLGERYDLIVDTAGTAPYSRSRAVLQESGRLLVVLGSFGGLLQSMWKKQIIAGPVRERLEALQTLAQLAEAGAFMPVIDRVYPMEEMVAAHRHVDTGHKRGNVVVTMGA